MAELARALSCAIVLDESAARTDQLERLPAGVRWIVNLRVSKMGGPLRGLGLASAAREAGLEVIVGAHVGETSVPTRAALTVVNAQM
jgi:L-alanine-DL-glutamate epimerase-like enolase superfamily enzyme